ncbi:MAG: methyltransferase domain-containing protein [Gammaproteobacteria bacterium]|jgi:ubiquinone/menaquinone biosynthesis C-methylase UbiE|nr:methyltransferase domain-containing protein [Gammaproteobacteria bacterium]
MGFYTEHIQPILIERGMKNKAIRQHRPLVAPQATGRVLEVGFGTGMNLPYYSANIDHFFGLEPSGKLLDKAEEIIQNTVFPVDIINSGAEDIPLETNSIDTIVTTWTLCSIPPIESALQEMRRVLKPGGRLLFLEHGQAPDEKIARLQRRMTPAFKILAGCSLDRQISPLIATAGFRFLELEETYFDGPKFLSFHYCGQATPL